MKTLIKFTLAAAFAAAVASTGALANDLKTVQIYNPHGSSMIVYRYAEPTTVAVYANGGSVGEQAAPQNRELRLKFRCDHHGHHYPQYVAQ